MSRLTIVLLSSIVTIINANWKTDCNYIIDEGNITATYATVFTDPRYENFSLPSRAYTMEYCNYAYDWTINLDLFYEYFCDNGNVRVDLYQGQGGCQGSNKVSYTFYDDGTSPYEFNCDAQEDCTMAISRYENSGYNTSCVMQQNAQRNSYGIVNGQCVYASDIGYMLKAYCDPDDPDWFITEFHDPYWSPDCTADCDAGECFKIEYGNIGNSSWCPVNSEPGPFGRLYYELHSCAGELYLPTTTLPGSTVYDDEACPFVNMDGPPVAMDRCIHYDSNGTSGMFYCSSERELNYIYWADTVNCDTAWVYNGGYESADIEIEDYSCMGSSENCEKIIYLNINSYSGPEDEIPTFDECRQYAISDPQVRIPTIVDECLEVNFGGGDQGLMITCDEDANLTVAIGEDTSCTQFDFYPNIQNDNATFKECVVPVGCPYINETVEECTWGVFDGPPIVIGGDEYCQSIPEDHFSFYITCIYDRPVLTFFNGTTCDEDYLYMDEIDIGEFGHFPIPSIFNCRGSSEYCDIMRVGVAEYNITADGPLPTEEECFDAAQNDPNFALIVVKDVCFDGGEFTCNDMYEVTINGYADNDTYCWNDPIFSDIEMGLGIDNNSDTSMSCWYFEAIDGGRPCGTAMPSMDPTIDPTTDPTTDPTMDPTTDPTMEPTVPDSETTSTMSECEDYIIVSECEIDPCNIADCDGVADGEITCKLDCECMPVYFADGEEIECAACSLVVRIAFVIALGAGLWI